LDLQINIPRGTAMLKHVPATALYKKKARTYAQRNYNFQRNLVGELCCHMLGRRNFQLPEKKMFKSLLITMLQSLRFRILFKNSVKFIP
jgi:hypothetical protein